MTSEEQWQPIKTAPKDTTALHLYSKEWIDADFNPSGVREGYWNDDLGWVTAKWNGCQDCWDVDESCEPTHWMTMFSPIQNVTVESDES